MAKLSDVAKHAGVSISAASKILNTGTQLDRISDECIQRVRKAAEEVGYYTNYHARSLQIGRSEMLGYVLGDRYQESYTIGWYVGRLASGLEFQSKMQGYELALISPSVELRGLERGIRSVREGRIDALAMQAASTVPLDKQILSELNIPVVFFEDRGVGGYPYIRLDQEAGLRKAIQHLADLGHRSILYVGPETEPTMNAYRRSLLETLCGEAGLAFEFVSFVCENYMEVPWEDLVARPREALLARLQSPSEATAVMAYNDRVGLGCLSALNHLQIPVPDRMSVVGFDDSHAQAAYPALTTVDHMLFTMGQRAADILIDMSINKNMEEYRDKEFLIDPDLIVRKSTGPAPSA